MRGVLLARILFTRVTVLSASIHTPDPGTCVPLPGHRGRKKLNPHMLIHPTSQNSLEMAEDKYSTELKARSLETAVSPGDAGAIHTGELTDVMETEHEAIHTCPGDNANAPRLTIFSMLFKGSAFTDPNTRCLSSPNLGREQGIKVFSYENSEILGDVKVGRVVVAWPVLRGGVPAPHLCEHRTLLRGQKIKEEKKQQLTSSGRTSDRGPWRDFNYPVAQQGSFRVCV